MSSGYRQLEDTQGSKNKVPEIKVQHTGGVVDCLKILDVSMPVAWIYT